MKSLRVLLIIVGLLAGCAAPTIETTPTVVRPAGKVLNLSRAAGLREATRIEILQMRALPSVATRQQTITDSQAIRRLVDSLDTEAALRPRSSCAFIYRLTFHLPNGRAEEFGFSCGDAEPILRGAQDYWQGMDIIAPARFQEIMKELIQ